MLDGGLMGKKLALQSSYGRTQWPKGFKPVKDYHIELVEFLELHKDEFASVLVNEISDINELKTYIKENKYRVCIVNGYYNTQYYTLTKEEYLCSFCIEEIKDGLYWILDKWNGAETIQYFKITPGSYKLEKVIE